MRLSASPAQRLWISASLLAALLLAGIPGQEPMADQGVASEEIFQDAEFLLHGERRDETEAEEVSPIAAPPAPPAAPSLTSNPVSASLAWPDAWAEGPVAHRAEMAALEGKPAPPWSVDRWLQGEPLSVDQLGEGPAVLAFWAVWSTPSRDSLSEIYRALESRKEWATLVTIHPDEASEELSEFLRGRENLRVAIDADHSTGQAYGFDSFPDYYLIGPGGVLFCADVRREHVVEALDAIHSGWIPWEPVSPPSASPEAAQPASPEAGASAPGS